MIILLNHFAVEPGKETDFEEGTKLSLIEPSPILGLSHARKNKKNRHLYPGAL
jgi:hypothetical protein